MSNDDRELQALTWLQRLREAATAKQSLVEYCRRHVSGSGPNLGVRRHKRDDFYAIGVERFLEYSRETASLTTTIRRNYYARALRPPSFIQSPTQAIIKRHNSNL